MENSHICTLLKTRDKKLEGCGEKVGSGSLGDNEEGGSIGKGLCFPLCASPACYLCVCACVHAYVQVSACCLSVCAYADRLRSKGRALHVLNMCSSTELPIFKLSHNKDSRDPMAFIAKPDDPSSIPDTHMVEREGGLPTVVLWPPHIPDFC